MKYIKRRNRENYNIIFDCSTVYSWVRDEGLTNEHVGESIALKINPFSCSICQTLRLVTLNISRLKAPDVFTHSRTNNLSASRGF